MPSHKNLPFQPPKPPRLEVISAAASPVLVTQKSLTPLSSVSSQTSPQSGSCSSWKPAAQLASGQNSESPQLPQLLPAAGLSSVCTGCAVRGWDSVCICIFTRCYPGVTSCGLKASGSAASAGKWLMKDTIKRRNSEAISKITQLLYFISLLTQQIRMYKE